jgi:hypothetical protein
VSKNWLRWCKQEQGGIVLEAALIMPFFLAFVLAMAVVIQLAVTDLALQRALTETTKPIAAYGYPMQLLAREAKASYENSSVGVLVGDVTSRVISARDKLLQGEQWADRYEAFIPDFILSLVDWEQQFRMSIEQSAQDQASSIWDDPVQPIVQAAFKKLVMQAADPNVINAERLRVVNVKLPNLFRGDQAFIGVEAEYDVSLPLPFAARTVTLRKQSYERLWVGAY